MDKGIVDHIYNEILVIKRNTYESVVVRWLKLERVIQSKVSQKEKKKKHRILKHVYGIYKNSTCEPIYREEMEMQM